MNKINNLENKSCPCGSTSRLAECCLSLINGSAKAHTAEQLMRSRYTAYVLGNIKYLLESWHQSTRPEALNLSDRVSWTGLHVLKVSEVECIDKEQTTFVEFIATFINAGAVEKMHERSRFIQQNGQWFYVDGEQFEMNSRLMAKSPGGNEVLGKNKSLGRNEPCFCGSGKKFKKCCGKNI